MLKILRTKTRKVMLTTLILVIPSFVFYFGWQSISGRQGGAAADLARFRPTPSARGAVKGWSKWVKVSREELLMTRRKMRSELRNMFGPSIDRMLERDLSEEELLPTKDIIRETIDDWYLNYFADHQKISVSDAELTALIDEYFKDYPYVEQREAILRNQGMNVPEFESRLRLLERFKRSLQFFGEQARPSLADLWDSFVMEKQKLRLDYAFFDSKNSENKVDISDAAIEAYYKQSGDKFRIGDQRLYRYAFLNKFDFTKGAQAPPDEVKAYYDEKKATKYQHGRQVRVRHILINEKAAPDMNPAQKAEATSRTMATAQLIHNMAAGGQDFAQLANTYSEDPMNTSPTLAGAPAKMGGLVRSWISQDTAWLYGQQFAEAALGLDAGKLSQVVPVTMMGGAKGLTIIKCEEVREAGISPFESVKTQVEADCLKDKTDKLFSAKGQDLKSKIRNYSTIDILAKDLGMRDGKTTWVLTSSPILSKDIRGLEPSDLEYVNTSLRKGDMGPLLRTPDLLYVLYVEDEKPSHVPADFREIRARVEQAYRADKSREMARSEAEQFLAAVKPQDFATTTSMKVAAKTTPFSIRADLPKVLPAPLIDFQKDSVGITTGTLGISPAGTDTKAPIGYVVWHARAIQDPTRKAFDEELPPLERDNVLVKRQGILSEWLWDQRSMTKIEEIKEVTE